jgi:hypothetical protein
VDSESDCSARDSDPSTSEITRTRHHLVPGPFSGRLPGSDTGRAAAAFQVTVEVTVRRRRRPWPLAAQVQFN